MAPRERLTSRQLVWKWIKILIVLFFIISPLVHLFIDGGYTCPAGRHADVWFVISWHCTPD